MDQTKQVFVDDSGRRGRLLGAAIRVGCLLVGAYLCLLIAGFLGASWVPSVRLPVVGDIFDVGRGPVLTPEAAAAAEGEAQGGDDEGEPSGTTPAPEFAAAVDDPGGPAVTSASRGERGPGARGAGPGAGKDGPARPAPQSSPNHGTASGNPNAGPKPEKTPGPKATPNRGSNGNSENAGPKPKPTKGPDHPSNSPKDEEPDPSPSPGT